MRIALAVSLLCSLVSAAARAADVPAAADVYVSPAGNDEWSGRLAEPNDGRTDGPLATPDAARRAVRKLRQADPNRAKPVTVLVRGGTYVLLETVTFTAADSGTDAAPVTYAAWPGEVPVLSGGVHITGWRVGPDGRWRVTLPDVKAGKWNFAQLFVDGRRRARPRLPGDSYHRISARVEPPAAAPGRRGDGGGDDRFRFPPGSIDPTWKNLSDVEVITFHPWFTSMLRVASVDPERNVVTFTGRTRTSNSWGQLKGGMRFLVDNVAEALDAPGEWYLDRPTGELTYIPLTGEDPAKTEVIAPRLARLVELTAAPDAKSPPREPWVRNVTFRGLTFAHTNWTTPPGGSSIAQAAVDVPGAVVGRGVRGCAFRDCTFTASGTYGLELAAGGQDVTVEGCRFTDLGAGGVKVGTTSLPADPDQAVSRVVVRDNLIAHVGRVHAAACGMWVGQADHVTIEHNDIYDLYYTGISVGWTWGYGPSATRDNTIAWNHVHTIGQGVLSDMACIYTLGVSPGTTIRHNHFHHVRRDEYGGWGVYYDEGSTGIVAENNLVYDTHDEGFHQHYGENNVVANNVLAGSLGPAYGPTRINDPKNPNEPRPGPPFTFERNIVVAWGAPSVIRPDWVGNKLTAAHLDKFKVDANVYWNGDKPVRFAGLSFEQWRAKGLDETSVVADPLLGDYSTGKVQVGPASPALKAGFKPFDVSAAGRLKREPADLDASRWPRAFPAPAPAGKQAIRDGFEQTPVGSHPDGAAVGEEGERATVRVTDAAALTGRRSLKFTDAAGLKHAFNPHAYWTRQYADGTVVARFALRPGGAALSHEWRTGGANYRTGPAVYVAADGSVRFRGDRGDREPRLKAPPGQWTVFEITCRLGGGTAAATYDVAVTPAGGETRRFTDLLCERDFDELFWFGFSTPGQAPGECYLDDLSLELR